MKAGHVALFFQKQCWKSSHHSKPNKACMCLTMVRNYLLASQASLLFFFFLLRVLCFNTELHVCIQRITSVLFYEIHRARLLFYPSCVWILLSCVILAAEGSQALELFNIFSLFRGRKLFMGWYLIFQLDFLSKLYLTVFWKSHYFPREFSEQVKKWDDLHMFFWRSFGSFINGLDFLLPRCILIG